jgi:hypothetical protein
MRAHDVTAELIDCSDAKWQWVLEQARHDFYARPNYVELEALREGGRPCGLLARDHSTFMLIPTIVRRVPAELCEVGMVHCDAMSPYGYPSIIIGGPDASSDCWCCEALRAIRTACVQNDICCLFVRLHPLFDWPRTALAELGEVVVHGPTVWIDVTCSDDEYYADLRQNHRRVIKRLRTMGVQARMDEDWRKLDDFLRVYHETMAAVLAESWYFFPREYFVDLRRMCREAMHLCLVEHEGVVLSAAILGECSGVVQYHLGGTANAYRHLAPSRLMFDYVRGWARARGNHMFHLGGGVGCREDSLYHFKAGFSPRRGSFSTWRMICDKSRFDELAQRRNALRGQSVPAVDRYFPPYRIV